jgi:hypothetical protein
MAITESRDITIGATPGEILQILVDLESLIEWSSAGAKGVMETATDGLRKQVLKVKEGR